MTRIAFLGTGLLGSGFAQAAATRGDSVTVWNRTRAKALPLQSFGITIADTPAQAVQDAQRVHLILKDDAAVEDVLAAARAGLASDAVLIDHSTTLPQSTAERAQRLSAQGLAYLHAPVFMGPAAARSAQGTMLVAGSRALYQQVQDALAQMTARVRYLGERSDLAAANKLFGNAMILGVSALMADVLTLAQATNVAPEDALELIGLLDFNAMVAGRGANMAKGDFRASFELNMARKDLHLMLQTAAQRPLATLTAIAERMDHLIAAGHGAKDTCVLGMDALVR